MGGVGAGFANQGFGNHNFGRPAVSGLSNPGFGHGLGAHRGYGHHRHYGDNRGFYGRPYGYGYGRRGYALGGLGLGLAARGLYGVYGYPGYGYDPGYYGGYGPVTYGYADVETDRVADDDRYCARRFRSYDPQSGTYLGRDGRRHRCR
ncbi:BA14K family protein [Methylobacterium oryzae CBMB20]